MCLMSVSVPDRAAATADSAVVSGGSRWRPLVLVPRSGDFLLNGPLAQLLARHLSQYLTSLQMVSEGCGFEPTHSLFVFVFLRMVS